MIRIVIDTVDKIPKEKIISSDICTNYPKHIEWVNKCYSEKRLAFIAKTEFDEIAGIAIVKKATSGNALKIGFFKVDRKYNSEGIGKALLESVDNYARSINCCEIYVTVKKKLDDVRKFFRANKFIPKDITRLDEIVYSKFFDGRILRSIMMDLTKNEWDKILTDDIAFLKNKHLGTGQIFGIICLKESRMIIGSIAVVSDGKTIELCRITVFESKNIYFDENSQYKLLTWNEFENLLEHEVENYEKVYKYKQKYL